MHIKAQFERGKFDGSGSFIHWANVCWKNYKNDVLTKEGLRLRRDIQLVDTSDENSAEEKLGEAESPYKPSAQDTVDAEQYRRDEHNGSLVDEALDAVGSTAKKYAECLKSGMSKGETAGHLGLTRREAETLKQQIKQALLPNKLGAA